MIKEVFFKNSTSIYLFFLRFHNSLYNLCLRMGREVAVNLSKNSVRQLYTIHLGFIYLDGLGEIRLIHLKLLLVKQTRSDFTMRLIWLHLNQQPRVS